MNILEMKDELTLDQLLEIAYYYGNNNSIMPEDNKETIDKEFKEWINSSNKLVEKLECEHPFKRLHWIGEVVFCNKCNKNIFYYKLSCNAS